MKPTYTALSLGIVMILTGCGTAPVEKKAEPAPMDTGMARAVAVEEQPAPEIMTEESVEVSAVAEPATMEPEAIAPVEVMEEEVAAPVLDLSPVPTAAPAPAPKRMLNIPTDPNSFLITVSEKTQEHPFHGQGQKVGFDVNGKQGREIAVTRGGEYKFIVDTSVQHDFYLSTSAAGWGAGTYTNGVEGQFIYEGEVMFTPNNKTPDLLYYQCRNHKYMGGKIFVLDKGEDLNKLKATLSTSDGGKESQRRRVVVTESSVKQKLSYAEMVLASGSAKRIAASGDSEAIGMLTNAKSQIAAAKDSLTASKLEQAMTQVDEGLRLMTAASRKITSESEMAGVDHKAKFGELSDSLKTYEASYKRNLDRAAKMKQEVKTTLNQAEYDSLVSKGNALADQGDYAAANKNLQKAQAMITSVLTDMLHAQTVTYDKNFETPKEEYEFELARTENYEELVPLAIEQRQPSKRALELIDSFVQKAAKIKAEGLEIAAKGDYKMAIMAMQASTSNLQRALRMAGVSP